MQCHGLQLFKPTHRASRQAALLLCRMPFPWAQHTSPCVQVVPWYPRANTDSHVLHPLLEQRWSPRSAASLCHVHQWEMRDQQGSALTCTPSFGTLGHSWELGAHQEPSPEVLSSPSCTLCTTSGTKRQQNPHLEQEATEHLGKCFTPGS